MTACFSGQDPRVRQKEKTACSVDLGTLEQGKLADMVVLDGKPLEGYWSMLRAKAVIKGGVIMVNQR